jgi:hypothetical protein
VHVFSLKSTPSFICTARASWRGDLASPTIVVSKMSAGRRWCWPHSVVTTTWRCTTLRWGLLESFRRHSSFENVRREALALATQCGDNYLAVYKLRWRLLESFSQHSRAQKAETMGPSVLLVEQERYQKKRISLRNILWLNTTYWIVSPCDFEISFLNCFLNVKWGYKFYKKNLATLSICEDFSTIAEAFSGFFSYKIWAWNNIMHLYQV